MHFSSTVRFACIGITAALAATLCAQELPHLRKQGTATQLIVEGQPFLAVAGELGNNSASSLEYMRPIWPRLASANLNTVLAAVSWAQLEPQEGKFQFELLDGLLAEARRHQLKLVLLWFGSWKNGLSSYVPYWVKQDYKRFPRIRLGSGRGMELLSTFGDASRDADAKAFRAMMRHLKSVDGRDHTVLMIQVENEVGVLRDSRDRSDAANRAYSSPVPKELMQHLAQHRSSLAPELLEAWKGNGFKSSGTWAEVFGPGKPESVEMPIQTTSPPLSAEEFETAWRKLTWPSDEFFMAWHYARYINRIIEEGKAEYNLPMFVNAWLQGPNTAWPGTYPSGGPLPQVHDIWRAGAPACDLLAPDLYLPQFDEVSERFIRNGNPLFIPETSVNPANALVAFGKYGAMGFSPFYIDRSAGPDTELAAAYKVITSMAPAIAAQQGKDTMTAIRMKLGDAPQQFELGGYQLKVSFLGRGRIPIAPEPKPAAPAATQAAAPAAQPAQAGPAQGAAILAASGPSEFYLGGIGGAFRIDLTPKTPGPGIVGIGDVQEGRFENGKWTVIRQLGGDDTGQGEILTLRPNTVMHVTVYRYE
ncbi:GH35 family beta-galactosidase [Paludibaculum fermentans]|uniref:DUF5597 domain-containing protein n=1 Tax=Paludibaculum fermentans TaxID=1473598 RepID=A0A7S7NTG1_PALFE|nr:DUF5597 domain-containing protein [Paludibaculum fermentans]QOY88934.1 DUF5597 domain-containing protein [Paludibaculum fermentans]